MRTQQPAAVGAAMQRALELAALGPVWGANPRVGCVILSPSGERLAEGWHRGAGTAHAEIDALSKLGGKAPGATVVVTLEPCNHTGRTGPCAEALLAAGVAEVVYAVADPGGNSSGGAARLAAAGVTVDSGLLADQAEELLFVWLAAMRRQRPFVTAKWGSSLDGRIAAPDGSSRWITGEAARVDVHERRALADAILVGTGTALADDPSLTARAADGSLLAHQPRPVVVGRRPLPADARLRQHPADVTQLSGSPAEVLAHLWQQDTRHAFIEGGPTLTSAFIAAGLVDEYLVYLAPTLLGGPRTATSDLGVTTIDTALRLSTRAVHQLGDDLLVIARPKEN